jgi:phosphatidylglycerophosphatase A
VIVLRPDARFAFGHPAHFIAFGFGAGLARTAPGTFGTLIAFPIYWIVRELHATPLLLAIVALLFLVGVWACELTGRHLGVSDHGAMCWDEVVAFLLILAVIPDAWPWQAAGFLVFRVFDILKPPPIRALERRFKGGFGVMIDDILAAAYTLLVLAVAHRLLIQ